MSAEGATTYRTARNRTATQRAAVLLLVGGAALAGACTEVPTDPAAPVSLQFDSLPAPSIVAGDTLRNVDGVATPLTARAFNVDGNPIADAPITFTVLPPDTTALSRAAVTVTPDGYVVAADTARASTLKWRVVAQAGTLQSRPTLRTEITIVLRPDSLEAVAPPTRADSVLIYDALDSTSSGARAENVRVRLLHDTITAEVLSGVATGPFLVRFSLAPDHTAAVLDSVRFINGTRREITTVVATGADGVATARVQAFPKAGATASDEIRVLATVRRRPAPTDGTPDTAWVRGSPVLLVLPIVSAQAAVP